MEKYKYLMDRMIKAGRRAFDISLQSGDGGNISVRVQEENVILIKASGYSFNDINYDNIILIDLDGRVLEGKYKPSKEVLTHLTIYKTRHDVNAIFHSHSPWAVTASIYFDELPSISLPLNMKIGRVPILDAGDEQSTKNFSFMVGDLLTKHPEMTAFIQRRHGIFCLSTDIVKAEYDAELIEESAKIVVLTKILDLLMDKR